MNGPSAWAGRALTRGLCRDEPSNLFRNAWQATVHRWLNENADDKEEMGNLGIRRPKTARSVTVIPDISSDANPENRSLGMMVRVFLDQGFGHHSAGFGAAIHVSLPVEAGVFAGEIEIADGHALGAANASPLAGQI